MNADEKPVCLQTWSGSITPEAFADQMLLIVQRSDGDAEVCHAMMDDLLCKTLKENGFGAGVEIFENTDKWYA